MRARRLLTGLLLVPLAAGCTGDARASADEHADHEPGAAPSGATAQDPAIPAGADSVNSRLAASPRHGEWAMVPAGEGDSVRAWVVYPERSTRAPVVLAVHEIFGVSTWIKGVADQLAADGYIAIAPDLLTGKVPALAPGDTILANVATAAIRTLDAGEVQRRLEAAGKYGMALPAALPSYGIVGFCWGGTTSFNHAVRSPAGLGAAVVYYGSSPATSSLASVRVPVLGLYAGDDARVNTTVPAADSALRALGRSFTYRMFEGAGHGFLRQQEGREGANQRASEAAWPRTIAFFRRHLGS